MELNLRFVFNEGGLTMLFDVGQIFFSKAKVVQDSYQSAFGDIFSFVVRYSSKGPLLRVPPNFMRAWSLSNELTA